MILEHVVPQLAGRGRQAAVLALERRTGMRTNFTGTLGEHDAAMRLGMTVLADLGAPSVR